MKKSIIFIMIMSLLLSLLVSCRNGADNEKTTDPSSDPALSVTSWATYGYDKIRGDLKPPEKTNTTTEVYLTRNETEGAQFSLWSEEGGKGVTFVLKEGGTDTVTLKYFTVRYIPAINRRQMHADPLIPYKNEKFDLEPKVTKTVYVDFTTNNTPAGEYKYVFAAQDENGVELVSFNVTLHVWNITYPEEPSLDTAMGISTSYISDLYGFYSPDVYKVYYDTLLEHKVSAYTLPVDILSDEADAYMSDPRVSSFRIGYRLSDKNLLAIYNKLKTNPVWLEKAFFCPLDEPREPEHLIELKEICEHVAELCPGLQIVVPFYVNMKVDDNTDQFEFMSQHENLLLCPKLNMWNDEVSYKDFPQGDYPSFASRIKAIQESGRKVWTYVCNFPQAPYANLQIPDSGLSSRVLFWQQYQKEAEGFLYWSTTCWRGLEDPYANANNGSGGTKAKVYGDGILLYPGLNIYKIYDFVRQIAPVVSIRLKIVRDGVEDFELLTMAEELFGREWVMDLVNKITPSLTEIKADNDSFASIRIEIGNAIENKLAEK